jgi:hypothetical protein
MPVLILSAFDVAQFLVVGKAQELALPLAHNITLVPFYILFDRSGELAFAVQIDAALGMDNEIAEQVGSRRAVDRIDAM